MKRIAWILSFFVLYSPTLLAKQKDQSWYEEVLRKEDFSKFDYSTMAAFEGELENAIAAVIAVGCKIWPSSAARLLRKGSQASVEKFAEQYLVNHRELVVKIAEDTKTFDMFDISALKAIVKHVATKPPFNKDKELLRILLLKDHKSILTRLQRYVLVQLREEKDLEFNLYFAASTISDIQARRKVVEEGEKYIKKRAHVKLDALIRSLVVAKAPEGYEMVKEFIGSGKTSLVSLVKRTSDGKLFAWKRPTSDAEKKLKDLSNEVDKAKVWIAGNFSKGEIFLADDKKSLFQEYVDGPTLKTILKDENSGFMTGWEDPATHQLGVFLYNAISMRIYFSSVNYENLIYSGGGWWVIDSGGIETFPSARATFDAWKSSALKAWTRQENYVHRERIEKFFAAFEKHFLKNSFDMANTRTDEVDKAIKELVSKQETFDNDQPYWVTRELRYQAYRRAIDCQSSFDTFGYGDY